MVVTPLYLFKKLQCFFKRSLAQEFVTLCHIAVSDQEFRIRTVCCIIGIDVIPVPGPECGSLQAPQSWWQISLLCAVSLLDPHFLVPFNIRHFCHSTNIVYYPASISASVSCQLLCTTIYSLRECSPLS